MEPIISPWIFYWLHVLYGIHIVSGLVLVLSVIACALTWAGAIIEENKDMVKPAKVCTVIVVICTTIMIVIPDKNTMIAMMAASYITPDSIQLVQGNIVDFIKQIIDATK